jgi:hypothetical protein
MMFCRCGAVVSAIAAAGCLLSGFWVGLSDLITRKACFAMQFVGKKVVKIAWPKRLADSIAASF